MPTFLRQRTRSYKIPAHLGVVHNIVSGVPEGSTSFTASHVVSTCWDSGGNPKRNGKYQPGSFFRTRAEGVYHTPSSIIQVSRGGIYSGIPIYTGRMISSSIGDHDLSDPGNYSVAYDVGQNVYDADLFGAKLLSTARPDKPALDISQAIYELKDLPGMLRQRFLSRGLQGISDYYLALKFGWEPLLNDVRSFVSTTINASDLLENLQRDEGKNIRRRVNLGSESHSGVSRTSVNYAGVISPLVTQAYADVPVFTDQTSSFKRKWGVASFRYTLPGGPRGYAWKARQLALIYGAVPSPKTIFNIMPWSFLVDWFSGIGDYIDVMAGNSTVDQLFTNFAFVMSHKRLYSVRSTTGNMNGVGLEGSTVPYSTSATRYFESKERAVIDPFGPGFTGLPLSGTKQAILGALGLSNLPSNGPGYSRPRR